MNSIWQIPCSGGAQGAARKPGRSGSHAGLGEAAGAGYEMMAKYDEAEMLLAKP
jgi:hypothetical protein